MEFAWLKKTRNSPKPLEIGARRLRGLGVGLVLAFAASMVATPALGLPTGRVQAEDGHVLDPGCSGDGEVMRQHEGFLIFTARSCSADYLLTVQDVLRVRFAVPGGTLAEPRCGQFFFTGLNGGVTLSQSQSVRLCSVQEGDPGWVGAERDVFITPPGIRGSAGTLTLRVSWDPDTQWFDGYLDWFCNLNC